MSIELFVFDSSLGVVDAVAGAGAQHRADAIVVDWERSHKRDRQRDSLEILGIETQIAPADRVALEPVVAASVVPVICRIDTWSGSGREDLVRAAGAGVDEVILPMVSTVEEVDEAIEVASGRVGVGIMIETVAACDLASRLATRPITRAYLGLMDLALERRTGDLFAPLGDGTLDRVAGACAALPFGFGGLTLPGYGSPVPTEELAARMVEVGASFTFLRRSFLADSRPDHSQGLSDIRSMVERIATSLPGSGKRR